MDLDGLIGLFLAALLWGLPAVLGALKRKQQGKEAESGPPAQVRKARSPGAAARKRAQAAVATLERAQALASMAAHPELDTLLRESLDEARAAHGQLQGAEGEDLESKAVALRPRMEWLHERASLLLRVVEGRADPSKGALIRGLPAAVEEAVPRMSRRPVVVRGGDHERGSTLLADTPLLPLVLSGRPDRRPWTLGALIEDAWAAELLGEGGAIDAATERAAAESAGDDAMGRFASALAQAWAPALLLDAACTLSLADGHVARVRALIDEQGPNELFVIRLDASQRVDSVPPAGLRLMLLRRLLAGMGGPEAPPLPPNPVLHLRGPGVWDQAPLEPVLDHAARVQALFAKDLAEREGLQHPARIGEQARELLDQAAAGPVPRAPDARVLFAAAGLSAADPGELDRSERLLAGLSDSSVAAAVSARPGRRRRSARERVRPSSRKRVLREAVLLGAALGGRNPS